MRTVSANDIDRYRRNPLEFFGDTLIPTGTGVRRFDGAWADFQHDFFEAVSPSLLAVAAGTVGPYRGFWLERTKGGSKDSDIGLCLLWLLIFTPRPLLLECGADDQKQAQETHKAMAEIIKLNPWMEARVRVYVSRITCSATDSELLFLTTDKTGDGSHGSRPNVTVCNELSHVGAKKFIQTMLDNADKVPTNLRFICTNAGKLRSWQHQWRENYRNHDAWWFQVMAKPAPWVTPETMKDAEFRNGRSRYRRLWWGEWSSGEGDAINESDIQLATSRRRQPMIGGEEGYVFVSGLDLGVKHDHSALVTLGCRLSSGRVRLANCQSWAPSAETGKVSLIEVEQAVREEAARFDSLWIGYDPSQAYLMAERLARANFPMVEWPFSGKNTDIMARSILSAFRSRHLELYEEPRLIEDLHRLTITEGRHGNQRLTAASDDSGHADRAIALAICLPVALEIAMCDAPREEVDDFGQYDYVTT